MTDSIGLGHSRRGPGALNLNAVVAAHRCLAAPFRAPTLVVLTIGADDARAAYSDRHRGDGGRRYPSYASHMPSFEAP